MNNRFKFRIWDINTKRFYYMYLDELIGLTRTISIPKEATIQQYTGLNDNNDVSIYEGDILSECIDNRTELGICKQILGGWKIFSHPNSSICWHGNQHKVIGNIFETPQLLK